MRKAFATVAVVALAIGLGACRAEEQDRPLTFEPGVYGGAPDEELTDEARQTLDRRHDNQRF